MYRKTTDIGRRIYLKRKQKRLTQGELAERVGVAKPTINRYETGVIPNIPLDKITRIAQALDCSTAELLGIQPDGELSDNDISFYDVQIREIGRHPERLTEDQKREFLRYVNYMFPEFFRDEHKDGAAAEESAEK